MYNEREVEDSLQFCEEIKTYYTTGVFENPHNVYDWETFLPAAKDEVERRTVQDNTFQEQRLQDAIEFGLAIRNAGKQQGTTIKTESVTDAGILLKENNLPEKTKETIKTKGKKKEELKKNTTKQLSETEEEEEEPGFVKIMFQRFLEVVICVVIAFGLSAAFNRFIGTHTMVEGSSMEGTLHDGDSLFVSKISYTLHEPERFDIVVFPFAEDVFYIKRVIGLPNESVEIKSGQIYINDELLQENYGLEEMKDLERNYSRVVLGEDEYFVLGDNRNHSKDSRSSEVGFIKRDKIIGKAVVRFYPFDSLGTIE